MPPGERPTTTSLIDSLLGVQADEAAQTKAQTKPIPLAATDPQLHRKPTRRIYHDASRTRKAIEAIPELPGLGESLHVLMTGAYDAFDLIDAIIEHAYPVAIAELHLATLGFSGKNLTRLIEMQVAELVGPCTLIASEYFAADKTEAKVIHDLAATLPLRGGWYIAARSHAKVFAAELSDGRCLTIESSANLRSCRNLEQFTLTNDPELYAFHWGWMREVYAEKQAREGQEVPD